MENKKQKCSLKEHNGFEAISYCQKCEIYICSKCEKYHSSLFPEHKSFNLDKDISQIISGFCKVENHHQIELNFYCKNHNMLCCGLCITKIKREGYGLHSDCDVCNIEDIIDEKRNNLNSNIKILEDLSNSLQSSIDDLKIIFEKIAKNKEEIKLNIQKIFTKIRNAINDREDLLLIEVDKKYEQYYFNEDILKEVDKLPNRIKISLEKGKIIEKEWDNNNKLNSLINDCINIENNIKNINNINDKIKKCKSNKKELKFKSDEGISLLESIKNFGLINTEDYNNVQNNININILDFNPQNIKCIKKVGDSFGNAHNYIYDGICFFISKNNEYVLAYIDNTYKSIIYYDINNDKEIKRINNAHENNSINMIKYYNFHLYDIILSSSNNKNVKLWNYNENLNILTINYSKVYSSSLLFDNNSFYVFCAGNTDYIKIYNSVGNFYKNIGNNDETRYYLEIDEINNNKYIISGGNKGVNVFNYPSFSNYYCFKEENDNSCHNYAKIIKKNNIYNIIDAGNSSSNIIRIWDFNNKNLIKRITSNSGERLGGFILINNIYLIIASYDKEIKVFDINNGILVTKFNKHTSLVVGIKAIKDKDNKQYFVSYSQGDTNIYLWSLK